MNVPPAADFRKQKVLTEAGGRNAQKTNSIGTLSKVLELAIPFGKLRLSVVFALVVLQGLFQVAGVTSIFPFLALAAAPGRIYDSQFGRWFLSFLPELDNSQLLVLAGSFSICMMLLANCVCIFAEYHRGKYAHEYGHWLRLKLLNRILDQPYSYFLNNNSSVLFKKIYSDVMAYVNGILLPGLDAIARLFTCVLLILTLLFVHLRIALIAALVLTGFYMTIYFVLKKRRQAISDDFKQAWRGSAQSLNQLLAGIKPIKVHEVETNFADQFAAPSAIVAKQGPWVPIFSQVPRHIIEPVAFAGMISVVIYLNVNGRDLAAILPNMGVMALAGYKLLPAFQLVYGQLTKMSATRFTLEEIYDEFSNGSSVESTKAKKDGRSIIPIKWENAISLRDICFSYTDSDKPIFDGLSLDIQKNTSVAFVGKTGSGKSTIVDLLMGLHKPQGGQVKVDDQVISDENIAAFRATIGYVPQEVFLTDDTVAANIAFGIPEEEIDFDRVCNVAKTAQIFEFIETDLQDGFNTVVGERGIRLSGGQRQRIGLARALYRAPTLLILDEATSALDNKTEEELMLAINSLSHKITIIMIAHRVTTVMDCDQIFELSGGKLRSIVYESLQTNS